LDEEDHEGPSITMIKYRDSHGRSPEIQQQASGGKKIQVLSLFRADTT
jgi:hypothetical protein